MINNEVKDKKIKANLSPSLDRAYIYLYQFFWLVIVAVCLAVVAVGYLYFLAPKYNSVVSSKEITDKQQATIEKSQYYNQLLNLKKLYAKINPEDIKKIEQIVTTDNNQNDLYREIEYIAKKNGLTAESITPEVLDKTYDLSGIAGIAKKSPLLNNMTLTMTVCKLSKVNYEALIRVLKTFELNLRIMDVIKVEYDPAQQKATLNLITYQF